MTQPALPGPMQAPVDPLRVIAVLNQRLTNEITQSAVLQAQLQASQEHELDTSRQLAAALQRLAELEPEQESPLADVQVNGARA